MHTQFSCSPWDYGQSTGYQSLRHDHPSVRVSTHFASVVHHLVDEDFLGILSLDSSVNTDIRLRVGLAYVYCCTMGEGGNSRLWSITYGGVFRISTKTPILTLTPPPHRSIQKTLGRGYSPQVCVCRPQVTALYREVCLFTCTRR